MSEGNLGSENPNKIYTTPVNEAAVRNNGPDIPRRLAALDQMFNIIKKNEPTTADKITPEQSYNYTASAIVQNTENLQVKADLARIWIGVKIVEGDYANAVDSLLYGGIPNANIPEMQNADFVGGLFQKAVDAGDLDKAHSIAETVVRLEKNGEREKLFKTPVEGSGYNEGWETREKTLFEKCTQKTIEDALKVDGFDKEVYEKLGSAYEEWHFRDDGYISENPHPLATGIAKAYCEILTKKGNQERAYQIALEHLPEEYIKQFESSLPMFEQFKGRITGYLERTLRKVQKR